MRISFVLVPLTLALVCAAWVLIVLANGPHVMDSPIVSSEPRHLVTPKMLEVTASWSEKPSPAFDRVDSEGKAVRIGGSDRKLPQFVYFIKDGCPCSIEVEPLFHDLSKRYKGKIEFVGVIDVDGKKARRWHTDMLVNYPIVADPKLEVIRAYQATNSAFSALVGREGKILRMWPGYSVDLLKEINDNMAVAAGEQPKPFDTKWAPQKKAAGCAFVEPSP